VKNKPVLKVYATPKTQFKNAEIVTEILPEIYVQK